MPEEALNEDTYGQVWVTVHHPDLENSTTEVTVESFDEVWEEKGWVKGAEGESKKAAPAPTPPKAS